MENTDVKLKQKVQLRKKVEEPKQTPAISASAIVEKPKQTIEVHSPNIQHIKEKKSKKWIGILLAIIALSIIGFTFLSKPNKNNNESPMIAEEKPEFVDKGSPTEEIPAVKEIKSSETTAIISESASKENETDEFKINTEENNSVIEQPNISDSFSSTNTLSEVSDNIQAEALKVIRGDYGIGRTRKEKLGNKYQIIQNRVNELKREGMF